MGQFRERYNDGRCPQGGCSCRRRGRGVSPKLIVSMCHGCSGYHPSVRQRIEGKRLARAWLRDPDHDD